MLDGRNARISRRRLLQATAGLAGASAALTHLDTPGFAAPTKQSTESTAPAGIQPLKVKRAGVGLRGYDPDRAWSGYTLFAPQGANRTVYLVDMLGEVVHTWEMPYPPGLYGYLTERGTLFYNGRIPDESWLGRQPVRGGAALEVDWSGRVLWEVNHLHHHHDGIRLRNGNVLLLCMAPLPDALASRVQGGRPGSEAEGQMYANYLVEMTTDGRQVWEWRSWEHLDPETDVIAPGQFPRQSWTWGNGIAEWPDGNIVISLRQLSTVVTVDRRTGDIIWRLGQPTVNGQHAPTPLPNGHLLIFDNGLGRHASELPFSRVVEVDPRSNEIVWQWQEARPIDFFSPQVSNAQRLPNGNTLICEGSFGRIFEVTPEGEVVWEYVNPFVGGLPTAPANQVFRGYRYSEEEIARARR